MTIIYISYHYHLFFPYNAIAALPVELSKESGS